MPIHPCRACGRDHVVGENEPAGLCPTCRDVSTFAPPTLAAVAPPPLSAFPTLPGYEILGELGRGGMGVVYKARQTALNRVVALKVILVGAHASAEERARFRTEAETVARLHHPNTVQVYELGEWAVPGTTASIPYLSLEFCSGGSLDRHLKAGPMPPAVAAGLIECLARAIHDAHGRRVVHRDLKPANILFDDRGVPKIADFGMAKKLDEQGHTKSGTVMGTPSYMAPEQAEGKTKQTGPATDIYALGAILYECLTGRPPFRGETALDTIMAVLSEPVPAMAQTIPPPLNAICQRCLRKTPDERYPTALALADDLRRYLGGQRVAAFGMPREREKRSEKRGFPRGLAGVLAVLAVAAGVAFWMSRGDNEPDGDGEHRPGKNFEPAFRLPDAAGEFLRFESASPLASVAFSPDGRHLAGLSGRLIRVWDLEQRAVMRELKGEDASAGSLAFSRDGERILAGGGGTAVMWKVSEATELWRCGAPAEALRVQQVCWLGDERGFLARPASGTIEHRDAESGKLIRALTFAGRRPEPHDIAVRPRSNQIAVAMTGESGTGELVLGDVAADRRIRSFTPPALPEGEAHSPVRCAFSADGTLLLSGDKTGKVRLWKTETGELLHTFDGHQRAIRDVTCSPSGQRALSADEFGSVHVLDLAQKTEQSGFALHQKLSGVAFTPDGRHFASAGADGTVRIWGLPPLKD